MCVQWRKQKEENAMQIIPELRYTPKHILSGGGQAYEGWWKCEGRIHVVITDSKCISFLVLPTKHTHTEELKGLGNRSFLIIPEARHPGSRWRRLSSPWGPSPHLPDGRLLPVLTRSFLYVSTSLASPCPNASSYKATRVDQGSLFIIT